MDDMMQEKEVQDTEEAAAARATLLASLAQDITGKLQKAVTARSASGIEKVWQEDEEAYDGIDAANKDDESFTNNYMTRKPDSSGTLTEVKKPGTRSTILLNVTAHYVDGGAARLADMLLPTDDMPWRIQPTPIPEMINALPDDAMIQTTEIDPQTGKPKEMKKKEVVLAVEQAARTQAGLATKRIDDWLTECQWHAEVRKVIEDAARIGTGVLRGPLPRKQCSKVVMNMGGTKAVMEKEEILPGSRCVSPWNAFPDPSCGDNIHNGSHFFERDVMSAGMIRDFVGMPGYLEDQIAEVLKEGPITYTATGSVKSTADPGTEPYEVWYYTGEVRADILDGCGCKDTLEAGGAYDEDGALEAETVHVMLTMVNDRIIRVAMNPLDDGALPYDVMVWQRRYGHWAGIGIGRKVRTPQRIVTAATRAMMDNAGDSAGVLKFINQNLIEPADKTWKSTPNKTYLATNNMGNVPMQNAYAIEAIPSRQRELLAIIDFGIRMAEEVSGLPQLLSGQQGQATKTLGGMQLLNTNAHTTLRRLAKQFDDMITEPHIRRYYAWLLIYGEDEEKGDVTINAIGSSSMVEKDMQTQGIMQAGAMLNDPRFKIDPNKYAQEWFRSMRLDPERLQYTKGEEPPEQPPQPPVPLAVAQINAESKAKAQESEQAFKLVLLQQQQGFEAQMNQMAAQLEALLAEGEHNIDIEKIQAMLRAKQAEISKEFELANAENLMKVRTAPGYWPG